LAKVNYDSLLLTVYLLLDELAAQGNFVLLFAGKWK